MGRPMDGDARYGRRSALLALAVFLVGIPFGLLVHQVVEEGPLTGLDQRTARWLHRQVVDHDLVVSLMRAVTWLGSAAGLVVLMGLAVLWLLRRGERRLALFLVVVGLGGGAVSSLVKLVVGRPRPVVEESLATAFGKSFPSGHSMSSLVCFGALLVVFLPLVSPRWRRAVVVGTGLLVLAVGLSRLVLGVHYLSDVLGGYVLGGAWLAGSVALFETWRAERGRQPTAALAEGIEPEVATGAPHP